MSDNADPQGVDEPPEATPPNPEEQAKEGSPNENAKEGGEEEQQKEKKRKAKRRHKQKHPRKRKSKRRYHRWKRRLPPRKGRGRQHGHSTPAMRKKHHATFAHLIHDALLRLNCGRIRKRKRYHGFSKRRMVENIEQWLVVNTTHSLKNFVSTLNGLESFEGVQIEDLVSQFVRVGAAVGVGVEVGVEAHENMGVEAEEEALANMEVEAVVEAIENMGVEVAVEAIESMGVEAEVVPLQSMGVEVEAEALTKEDEEKDDTIFDEGEPKDASFG
ncbi:unnamed protein product [Calypogeia fissa]